VLRAREQTHRYARSSQDFVIVETDNLYLLTRYRVEVHVLGSHRRCP
jgi:hypothetical protein